MFGGVHLEIKEVICSDFRNYFLMTKLIRKQIFTSVDHKFLALY